MGAIESSPFLVRTGVPITPTMSPRLKLSWTSANASGSLASLAKCQHECFRRDV